MKSLSALLPAILFVLCSLFPNTAGAATSGTDGYTGWSEDGQHWYDDGVLAKQKEVRDPDSGNWYYFDANGDLYRGVKWVPVDGGKWVYYDVSTGIMAHGEKYLNYDSEHTGWYYFDDHTGAMVHDVVWVPSNGGKWVYYDHHTGIMAHGEAYLSYDAAHTGWYFFDWGTGAMYHGWMHLSDNGGKWVYYDNATGIMAHGESYVTGDIPGWCFFDMNTGAVQYGWRVLADGRTVYYDSATGRMYYGWHDINGTSYYFNETNGNLEQTKTYDDWSGGNQSGSNPGSSDQNVGVVYWSTGSSATRYHKTPNCTALKRSHVASGSVDDAMRAGKSSPCHLCF